MKLVSNIFKFGFLALAIFGVYSMFFLSENVEQFIGTFITVIFSSLGALAAHYSILEDKK